MLSSSSFKVLYGPKIRSKSTERSTIPGFYSKFLPSGLVNSVQMGSTESLPTSAPGTPRTTRKLHLRQFHDSKYRSQSLTLPKADVGFFREKALFYHANSVNKSQKQIKTPLPDEIGDEEIFNVIRQKLYRALKLERVKNLAKIRIDNITSFFSPFFTQYRKFTTDYILPPQRDGEQRSAEDLLFDMFRNEETNMVPMGKFLAALRTCGIRTNDPRVSEMMDNLGKVHKLTNIESGSPETQNLNRETFISVIAPNIVLIARAFRHQLIIPDFLGFTKDIEEIFWKCKSNTDGKNASYIPQLARANSDHWGLSIMTVDGQRFSIGDSNIPFTLQSCSKPLTYAIALEQLGASVVHQYVGQEPSGRMFNELVLDYQKKPHNPMINAGSILTCSLIKTLIHPEMGLAEKFDYTQHYLSRMAGGASLGFNNAVFLSEREAADRNYALGFYMREHKCFPEKANLRECMDYYFQICSMEATCEIMSIIASTLANGGVCPITEEKVLRPEVVRDVLSLMHSCGMYDYSGQFAFRVGLPSKSGVSGGIMLVVPNVMGLFCWSPPLDPVGNSVRGIQFCEELVKVFNFHRYDNLKHATNKKDPTRHRYETKGLSIVNLLFSAASGDVTALRRHKLSGMDVTMADYDGRTALHLAAAEGNLDCVKFLLEQCEVHHSPKDRWGNSPLDEAETFGHTDVVTYIHNWIENKANRRRSSESSDTNEIDDDPNMKDLIRKKKLTWYDKSLNASPPLPQGFSGAKPPT